MRQLLAIPLLLLTLCCCTTERHRTAMRQGLDSLNHRNRTDQPFTVQEADSFVRFFDRHGTANDRLLAHYLLGRAYYEAGEAPMALECYHDAIECADTTDTDCDFAQLSRVYAQMAEVFYYQDLYRQLLEHLRQAAKYAWKGKDTLAALMCYEPEFFAYKNLGMRDSALFIIEDVFSKYNQYGYLTNAAISVGLAIRILIEKGDYQKAKKFMDIYESGSGRFDTKGNIEPKREIYYKVKGLYYLYNNILDSAEYFFRKELRYGKDFNNQNAGAKGLAKLYQKLRCPDSVAKYALYAYAMSDSLYKQKATSIVENTQSLYNYSRYKEIARREHEKVSAEKKKRQTTIILSLLISSLGLFVIIKLLTERKKRHVQYIHTLEKLERTQSELLQLREHADEYEELIAEKKRQLSLQQSELQKQRIQQLQDHTAIDQHLKESDIYQTLQKKQYGQKLTSDELHECRRLIIENLPVFNSLLLSKQYKLNEKDFNVCILFRLGFKSKEVSCMLDVTQGRISQICSKILKQVFERETGRAADLINLLCELY
ncbi:MAG: hypothetical protein ILA25_07600 [Prevotella sp.]|nr:hypothetical protein [Prevotella sp.]